MAGRKQFTTNLRTEPVDVTASRAIGYNYQNTFKVPIHVQIAFNVDHQDVVNTIDIISSTGLTEYGFYYNVHIFRFDANQLPALGDVGGTINFLVPAGQWYQVIEFSGLTSRIDWFRWVEIQL